MKGRKTSWPTSGGSLLLCRDILIACIEKHACWGGLQWAFGSENGPRTVKELSEITPYALWCVNNYVLPRPHREELYLLIGCSRMRGGRECNLTGYYERGGFHNWPAGRVLSVADMYPAKKKGGAR